jgi:hypothetical protein
LKRKGLNSRLLSERSSLPESVIEDYLAAKREIRFAELNPLCAALAVAPMRIIGKNFVKSRLAFRRVNAIDLAAVGRVEEAFLLIGKHLPVPRQPRLQEPDLTAADPQYLIATLYATVEQIRKDCPTVTDLIHWLELPILPVSAGVKGFDACLFSSPPRFAIGINRDKSPVRIHFSLLHEIAHYLFDRDCDIPLDTNIFEFYGTSISPENRREYIANKFAQNYLVPFDDATRYARQLPFPQTFCADLRRWRTSSQVVAHALYDQYLIMGRRPSLPGCQQQIQPLAEGCPPPDLSDIQALLDSETARLKAILERHAASYSDEILDDLKGVFNIE